MNKKLLLAILIMVLVMGFVFFVRISSTGYVSAEDNAELPKNSNETSKILSSELNKHNSEKDCWIIYSGKIYDITSFLPKHPGGVDKIARYCGTEGFEEAFTKKHGTSKVNLLMQVGTFIGDFDVIGNA